MNAQAWLTLLSLSALLGAVGQMFRVVPGIYKLNEDRRDGKSNTEFSGMTLLISVLLGALAGVAAGIGFIEKLNAATIEVGVIVAIITSGYAGSDFIEGFIKKYIPGPSGGGPAGKGVSVPATEPAAVG